MDFLGKSFAQLKDLLESMSPGTRLATGLLLLVVVVSLGYLFTHEMGGPNVYLMGGEVFSPRDLPRMEAAFAKAGLGGHEYDGGKIRVPRGQESAFVAALAEGNALPHNFGDILDKAVSSSSLWASPDQRKEIVKNAKQQELSLIISSMKGIETAAVMYDTETRSGLTRDTVRTASVNVVPAGPQPLDESLVSSIRHSVCSAIAGLKPEHVAVIDLNNGHTFHGGSEGMGSPLDDPYISRSLVWERHYRDKILDSLSQVQGVIVNCSVDLDPERIRREQEVKHDPKTVALQTSETTNTRSSDSGSPGGNIGYTAQVMNSPRALGTSQSQGNSETEELSDRQETLALSGTRVDTETVGFTKKSVTVAVGVPQSYFKSIWEEQNPPEPGAEPVTPDSAALDAIETEQIATITSTVEGLLSDTTGQVTVSVFPDVKTEVLPVPTMGTKAITWFGHYWGTLGLIGLGFFSLLMLRSTLRAVPAPALQNAAAPATLPIEGQEEAPDTLELPTKRAPRRFNTSGGSLRDELSELVSSDPDAAANILRTWISSGS